MRITVNLTLFFHDHRSLAKIFINKKMKCIRNVEEHISAIFKIEHFYLKCENQYLPPTEDVQILDNDDIVWAVPIREEYDAFNLNNVFPQNEEVMDEANILAPKKKKKKKRLHTNTREENFDEEIKRKKVKRQQSFDTEMEVEITPTTQKKKKKKKRICTNIDVSFTNAEQIEEHQKLKELNSNPGLIQKDSGRDSLDSSKSAETPGSKNSVKCLVNEFEKKKIPFTKELNESPNEPERKINIVKTIIISNKSTALSSLPNTSQTEACEERSNNTYNNVSFNGDSLDKNDEHQANESSSNAETSSVCLSNLPELDTNVNKRRRRRTHKRRSGMENTSEITTTYEQPVYNFIHKPLIVQTQTPTHLRFTDNQLCPKKEDILPTTESVVDKLAIKDSSHEVIILNESPKTESVDVSNVINENIEEKVVTVYSDKELEECILKQPVIQNLEPRIGDVIAFKILIISENYTPEVSKPIVGKVIDYNDENKEITFDIVYGHEQCLPPKGKFSLDEGDYQLNESSQFKCLWVNLFEPRLVYP